MAKVTYLDGDTSQYGYVFEDGKSVEVTDAKHLAKFSGNPFFKVSGKAKDDEEPATGLSAVHNGGGKFIIIRDGDKANKVKDGLTKADADAFNALSDDDKAAYVAD